MTEPIDDWHHCYTDGWTGLIVPAAFGHPAKFSRALIQRIYQHLAAEGWLHPGNIVIDPFGGVALGAHDAQLMGLNWIGVELEQKFVDLGRDNLALWAHRYRGYDRLGSADLLQGDSRHLAEVIAEAGGCVTSPPYVQSINASEAANDAEARIRRKAAAGIDVTQSHNVGGPHSVCRASQTYGAEVGQLGAMPPGNLDAAISSPPFAGVEGSHAASKFSDPAGSAARRAEGYATGRLRGHYASPEAILRSMERANAATYGETPGQLAALPLGSADAAITSPPFGAGETRDRAPVQPGEVADNMTRAYTQDRQGTTPGNLAHLDAAVSSPPYSGDGLGAGGGEGPLCKWRDGKKKSADEINERGIVASYGNTPGQLGEERSETFWTAARQIVEQLYIVLKPGAHAVFVVKAFVRDGQIVDFPGQWRALCEACGFITLHEHRAWLVEDGGTQIALDGQLSTKRTERKSFFRRLAERNGSPRIDWETVYCMERRP